MEHKRQDMHVGSPGETEEALLQQSELGWCIAVNPYDGTHDSRPDQQNHDSWYRETDEGQAAIVFY